MTFKAAAIVLWPFFMPFFAKLRDYAYGDIMVYA